MSTVWTVVQAAFHCGGMLAGTEAERQRTPAEETGRRAASRQATGATSVGEPHTGRTRRSAMNGLRIVASTRMASQMTGSRPSGRTRRASHTVPATTTSV